jgi:hypothetical protein
LSCHIRPKCPHVLVQRPKVKEELPKKDFASTRPPRKHQAQRKNYQGMLHQCTKLPYVTNVELIVMLDPRVLNLRRTHLEILDLMQDIMLQGINENSRGLFL